MVAKIYKISGDVQGVGFRYSTRNLASGIPVAGYVKNLPDGDVELLLRGEEESIKLVMGRVKNRFRENISAVDVTFVDENPHLTGFSIRL